MVSIYVTYAEALRLRLREYYVKHHIPLCCTRWKSMAWSR